jgi:hypothetical protein
LLGFVFLGGFKSENGPPWRGQWGGGVHIAIEKLSPLLGKKKKKEGKKKNPMTRI